MATPAGGLEEVIAVAVAAALRPVIREEVERAMGALMPSDLDTGQAARIAGVQPKTIRDWVATGKLRATRQGRSLRITRDDLDRARAGTSPDPSDAAAQALRSLRGRAV